MAASPFISHHQLSRQQAHMIATATSSSLITARCRGGGCTAKVTLGLSCPDRQAPEAGHQVKVRVGIGARVSVPVWHIARVVVKDGVAGVQMSVGTRQHDLMQIPMNSMTGSLSHAQVAMCRSPSSTPGTPS